MSISGNQVTSDNTGRVLSGPEWRQVITQDPNGDDYGDQERGVPIVLVKGTTASVTYTLYRPRGMTTYTGTVTVAHVYYAGQELSVSPRDNSVSVAPGAETSITFAVGPFPNVVKRKYALKIYFSSSPSIAVTAIGLLAQQGVPADETGGYGGHPNSGFPTYLVYSTPTAPQEHPWVGVLDDACLWAGGQSTDAGVKRETTLGLFNGNVFMYLLTTNFSQREAGDTDGAVAWFSLKEFLESGRPTYGNCYDVSNYLTICMSALGVNAEVVYELYNGESLSNPSTFTTNPLYPIGGGTCGEGISMDWTNHQMTVMNTLDLPIYDACLALETDPYGVYQGTAATPAFGISFFEYWQNQIGSAVFGVVNSPAPYPNPDPDVADVKLYVAP